MSYFVELSFASPQNFFIPSDAYTSTSITYNFKSFIRPAFTIVYSSLIIICIVVTLTSLAIFLVKLFKSGNNLHSTEWLPEQKWTVAYLLVNILNINPIGTIALLQKKTYANPQMLPFSNMVLSYIGVWAISCIWLFYSAPLLCRQQSPWLFYTPRILYCLITCVLGIIAAIYGYSDVILNQSDSNDDYNWPEMNTNAYFTIITIYQSLKWFYFAIWITQMAYTRYQLSKLSYMKNRYLHLSFRYFTLQGSLLLIFYIIRFFVVDTAMFTNGFISFVSAFYTTSLGRIEVSMDFLFQTVYCIILAYIYLPINNSNRANEIDLNILNAYVITEKECTETVKLRKHLFQNINQFQKLTEHQVYICCIDRAIELCKASYEVYFDQPGQPTTGGSGHDVDDLKDMDLESMGYTFIAQYNDDKSDTFCCIGRHKITRKLLIMYRGTSSMKNWKTNSKYKQVAFLLHKESPQSDDIEICFKEFGSNVIYRSSGKENKTNNNIEGTKNSINYRNSLSATSNSVGEVDEIIPSTTNNCCNVLDTVLGCFYAVLTSIFRFSKMIIGHIFGATDLYEPFVHE